MHCNRLIALLGFLCLIVLTPPSAAFAQAADPDAIEIPVGESGQEFKETIGRSRVETELIYLDPLADETLPREAAKAAPAKSQTPDLSRYLLILILIVVLGAIVLFASKFAPKTTISMWSPKDGMRSGGNRNKPVGDAASPLNALAGNQFLNELRTMTDRRAALILLSKRALEHATEIHGLPLGRSQTAREILRRLPRSWDHHAALSKIVGFEERVQFGGRDLPEPVFQESLSLAEPLFQDRQT